MKLFKLAIIGSVISICVGIGSLGFVIWVAVQLLQYFKII